ncbi:DUF4198 domain-containing protein [Pseudophaeobacter sp.]|uniref:DUF4198 domain-containing protein n=1 Tax=Pseudophaeobacter sp. TaxID=1971739 RepID=UPI0040584F74
MPNLSVRSIVSALPVASFLAALTGAVAPASAHEFWIEPEKYQVNSDDSLKLGLRNGQMFKGARLPYFANRTRRFDWIQGDQLTPYQGRMGDMPAMVLQDVQPGLLIALHETTPDLITYDSWDKFAEFAEEKGFGAMRDRQARRGLPENGFVERYSRHAKLLVSVGHGAGRDRAFGLETEFVALQNPYALSPREAQGETAANLPLRLLYQANPRANAQVEIYERAPDGAVRRSLAQTDAKGEVQVPLRSNHSYLLNAVVLRPVSNDPEAVWETLWASLVFALP